MLRDRIGAQRGLAQAVPENGYSLLELLVVIAIMALLATIAVPQLFGYLESAKEGTAKTQIQSLSSALDLYRLDQGDYPTTQQGLAVLVDRPAQTEDWNGPYIRSRDSLTDPWGQPYQYKTPGDHLPFDLYSYGPDGPEGPGANDPQLRNW